MNVKRIAKETNVPEEELLIQSTPFTEWNLVPWMDSHYGSLGQDENSELVFILTTDNVWHKVPVEGKSECFYDHQGINFTTGMSVADYISEKGIKTTEIDAVIVDRIDYRNWQGQDLTDEREIKVFPAKTN
jgi:hypothetical protein